MISIKSASLSIVNYASVYGRLHMIYRARTLIGPLGIIYRLSAADAARPLAAGTAGQDQGGHQQSSTCQQEAHCT